MSESEMKTLKSQFLKVRKLKSKQQPCLRYLGDMGAKPSTFEGMVISKYIQPDVKMHIKNPNSDLQLCIPHCTVGMLGQFPDDNSSVFLC